MALWRRHLTGWQPVHQCCFPSLPAVECGRLDGQGKYIMRALQAGHTVALLSQRGRAMLRVCQ